MFFAISVENIKFIYCNKSIDELGDKIMKMTHIYCTQAVGTNK